MNHQFGIEIELAEGASALYRQADHLQDEYGFSLVGDSSLSGVDQCEVVTQPLDDLMAIDDTVQAMRSACRSATRAGAEPYNVAQPYRPRINRSCGLHVHIGMPDATWQTIRNVWAFTNRSADAVFFATNPRSRREANFAHRTQPGRFASIDNPENLYAEWYGIRPERDGRANYVGASHSKYQETRYNAVNLHSWFYRGTVEFRHHAGTVDPRKIRGFVQMCDAVCTAAERYEGLMPSALAMEVVEEPDQFADFMQTVDPDEDTAAYLEERWRRHSGHTLPTGLTGDVPKLPVLEPKGQEIGTSAGVQRLTRYHGVIAAEQLHGCHQDYQAETLQAATAATTVTTAAWLDAHRALATADTTTINYSEAF